jgi:hypothetical protein
MKTNGAIGGKRAMNILAMPLLAATLIDHYFFHTK